MAQKKAAKKDVSRMHHESEEMTYRDLCSEELLFTQWRVADELVEFLVDKSVNIVRDKELAKKIPAFSLNSALLTIKKAISMRSYESDKRLDDEHLDPLAGVE